MKSGSALNKQGDGDQKESKPKEKEGQLTGVDCNKSGVNKNKIVTTKRNANIKEARVDSEKTETLKKTSFTKVQTQEPKQGAKQQKPLISSVTQEPVPA